MSAFKLLPEEPSEAMIRAIDAYFDKWQGIVGGSDTKRKADCWSAYQVYKRMYEAAESDPVKALAAKLNETDAARYRWLRLQYAQGLETYLAESVQSQDDLDKYIDAKADFS